MRQHYRDTPPIWSELWRQAKVKTTTMTSNTPPQIEDTAASTKKEIIQAVRMMNIVCVDELTETNYVERHNTIDDAIVQAEFDWNITKEIKPLHNYD